MSSLSPMVKEFFFETLAGRVSMPDFEKWAKSSYDLTTCVSPEDHKTLMTIDYGSSAAPSKLLPFINGLVDAGEYETYRMLKLLNEAKLDNAYLPKLLEELYTLYLFEYMFLKDIAGLLRDKFIANPTSNLQPELRKEAQKIIDWISTGKIVLTGEWDDDARCYYYKDHRTDRDRNPSTGDPLS